MLKSIYLKILVGLIIILATTFIFHKSTCGSEKSHLICDRSHLDSVVSHSVESDNPLICNDLKLNPLVMIPWNLGAMLTYELRAVCWLEHALKEKDCEICYNLDQRSDYHENRGERFCNTICESRLQDS